MKQKRRKGWKVCLLVLLILAIIPAAALGISAYVVNSTEDQGQVQKVV